jgi:cation transport ATPase
VDGRPAVVGKPEHALRLDQAPEVAGRLAELEGQGKTAVLVADGGRPLGPVAVAGELRPETTGAVAELL